MWVTTSRREVGLGYGWLMRALFVALAAGSLVTAALTGPIWPRELATSVFVVAGLVAGVVSVVRRSAGVRHQREQAARRSARVTAMTGIDRRTPRFDSEAPEFPPVLDALAAALGLVATLIGAVVADGPTALAIARTVCGALFVGALTDTMLLGHWYLVQPGLRRAPLLQLVRVSAALWIPETVLLLWPTGMFSVFNGSIDDGYNGLLGWFWVACTITTIGLVVVTRAALRERQYSAVMAATGLMYLAMLTAAGQDLVARILLVP